jgi:hypothetical protein
MPRSTRAFAVAGILLSFLSTVIAAVAQEAHSADSQIPASQTFALTDTNELTLVGVKAEAVEYKGRKAIRLTAQE